MKRATLAGILVLLLIATGAPPRAATLRQPPTRLASIPLQLATRHAVVKVRINGSRPLSFVLDTGAGAAIVRMDTAIELGLALGGTVNTGGAGPGTQTGRRVEGATWSLEGLEQFQQPVVLALPFAEIPSALGRDIDGIIGGEFIRQFVIELDYQARILTLHDRDRFTYTGQGEALPLEFTPQGHPVLRATITSLDGQPLERQFLVDIGSGLALALHSPFVAEQNLLGPSSKTVRGIGLAGAGGRSLGRMGRIAALRLGSFTIDKPIVLFSQDTAGAFANATLAGNIGAQIVSRFRSVFDYGRRRLILEPSSTFGDPFDLAFSGLALRAEGPGYRTFRVHEVLEESPASEAGIAEGDVIAAIDDTPAGSLTLSDINEMFEKPASYRLTIRRGDRTLTIGLTPRTMI